MRTRAKNFSHWLLLLITLACLSFVLKGIRAQETQKSPPPSSSEIVQLTERVRSPSVGGNILERAFQVGTDLIKEGRWAEGFQLFDALAERLPNDSTVLYCAALTSFNSGRVADAEQFINRAVAIVLAETKKEPNNSEIKSRAADALVLQAVVFANRKNENAALESARSAVNLAPGSFDAQFALGRALFGAEDFAGAARAFQSAVSLRPADLKARFFLATTLEKSGDDASALKAYRELIAKETRSAEGHLGLGVLLVKLGGNNQAEGIAELERCISIEPNNYEARVTLGRVLVSKGRASDAIEHLRVAANLAPNNPEPHYQLSLAYRKLGRKDEAEAESAIVKRIHESRRGAEPSASATPEIR
jgi:tetratricopeptide (TPR) repeat protein